MWVKKDWTSPFDPFFNGKNGGPPIASSHSANGWLGGVQAGCNYQVGSWVLGIQGDYDWANASGSSVDLFFGSTISSKVKNLASVTGRVGYAWDRFLGYVKGGGAWERDEYTATFGPLIGTASETRSGWTIGIGGEYAFTNNLSAFIEYDWYDFGTKANTLVNQFGGFYDTVDIKEHKSVLKVGFNWKFGNTPVVAKY
jgi:outer membrane immunogenic protein